MTANRWKKSTHSQPDGDCVEVHHRLDQVRDSKDPDGPRLVVDPSTFVSFVDGVKAGRFDR